MTQQGTQPVPDTSCSILFDDRFEILFELCVDGLLFLLLDSGFVSLCRLVSHVLCERVWRPLLFSQNSDSVWLE